MCPGVALTRVLGPSMFWIVAAAYRSIYQRPAEAGRKCPFMQESAELYHHKER